MFPSSAQGNCEGWGVDVIDEGAFGDLDLSGCVVAWATWWPGPIHEGGGLAHAFVDCETADQFDALASIYRGEQGNLTMEIFATTFAEPVRATRATVDVHLAGKESSFSIEGVGGAVMQPLRSPIDGSENELRIVIPSGFIWTEARIAETATMQVELPELRFASEHTHAASSPSTARIRHRVASARLLLEEPVAHPPRVDDEAVRLGEPELAAESRGM